MHKANSDIWAFFLANTSCDRNELLYLNVSSSAVYLYTVSMGFLRNMLYMNIAERNICTEFNLRLSIKF